MLDEHNILFIHYMPYFGKNLSYQYLKNAECEKNCNVNQALKLFSIHQEQPDIFLCSAIILFVYFTMLSNSGTDLFSQAF